MSKVIEALKWVTILIRSPKEFREKLYLQKLDDILEASNDDAKNPFDKEKLKELRKTLMDKSQFNFVGFMPNVMYIKKDAKSSEDLNSLWVHPWGTTTMIFASKKLPIMVAVNPGMRFNETIVNDFKLNRKHFELLGFTG